MPNQRGPKGRSEENRKPAETREQQNLSEAGKKGGEHSQSGGRKSSNDE